MVVGYGTLTDGCSRIADTTVDGGSNNKKDGRMPQGVGCCSKDGGCIMIMTVGAGGFNLPPHKPMRLRKQETISTHKVLGENLNIEPVKKTRKASSQ